MFSFPVIQDEVTSNKNRQKKILKLPDKNILIYINKRRKEQPVISKYMIYSTNN